MEFLRWMSAQLISSEHYWEAHGKHFDPQICALDGTGELAWKLDGEVERSVRGTRSVLHAADPMTALERKADLQQPRPGTEFDPGCVKTLLRV